MVTEEKARSLPITAPVVTVSRHRILCDGQGVRSLVVFHGCPLRCKWCINPFSFDPNARRTLMTAEELYDQVKVDELYYLATGGGVTFGGGEPLLYSDFLREFRALCGPEWHLCAETSLAISPEAVAVAASVIDLFFVDCKDLSPEIYQRYTGQRNDLMKDNLKRLLSLVSPERIVVRLPLIPDYNTEEDRQKSRALLSEMGITQIDLFSYIKRPKTRGITRRIAKE